MPTKRHNPGFTLVEVLVSMLVLAVLIGVLLPALRSARQSGAHARTLSGLRQTFTALQSYAGDQRDAWPFPQQPGRLDGIIRVQGVPVAYSYFLGGRAYWANLLVGSYIADPSFMLFADVEEERARNIQRGLHPDTIMSRFVLVDTAFARPEWFGERPLPAGEGDALLAGTRHADVRFPSRKAMLNAQPRRGEADTSLPPDVLPLMEQVARADGSAGWAPIRGFDPSTLVDRHQDGVLYWPGFSTRDGLRGIDFGL